MVRDGTVLSVGIFTLTFYVDEIKKKPTQGRLFLMRFDSANRRMEWVQCYLFPYN